MLTPKINDRLYILLTDADDYFAVTVIPATVRRVLVVTEADADGAEVETTQVQVRYDGESNGAIYNTVNLADCVVPNRYSYNDANQVGIAVLTKIESMKVAPVPAATECPPPMVPQTEPIVAELTVEVPF